MGILGGRLKIAVGDAPEKGKANAELTAFLAKQLGLRRRDVSVNQGLTTAIKVIRIENTDEQHVRRALGLDEAE